MPRPLQHVAPGRARYCDVLKLYCGVDYGEEAPLGGMKRGGKWGNLQSNGSDKAFDNGALVKHSITEPAIASRWHW